MSVRVIRTDHDRDYVPFEHTHADAVGYDLASDPHVGGIVLHVFNADHRRVATYAPGVWASAELMSEPESVNAAADPLVKAAHEAMGRSHMPLLLDPERMCATETTTETTATTEAVLSETSEPYVSVSVSANGSDELAKLIRKLIREKGAKSFGLAAS